MLSNPDTETKHLATPARTFLPPIGSRRYYILLGAVALLILGPLGGVSAAYMNFSLGFFVCGQVLAGILGSVVTYGYGAEGKHGANYMQTMAASVADIGGMAVLIQAMVWLGLPEPPAWKLILYLTCIGMFGVGVGMLYTPILVDRMQLTYPSGLAVANILRALTDKSLLKRSIAKLGGGTLGGFGAGLLMSNLNVLAYLGFGSRGIEKIEGAAFSASGLGAGMIVGARIGVPALLVSLIGLQLTPYLRSIGWLGPNEHFRKIGFLIGLGAILGAAAVDLTLIAYQAIQRLRQISREPAPAAPDWKRVNMVMLLLWVMGWAAAVIFVGSQVMHQPVLFLSLGVALAFLFVFVNGISNGISDWNPISSAFVVSILIMAAAGLTDVGIGLMCGCILLVSCNTGVDMQQDRSTGWRLGTNRRIQFRYQVIGIVMGAILAVVLAKLFMNAYPVLRVDIFTHPDAPGAKQWSSAMTYKFVGALKGLTKPSPHQMTALRLGLAIGLVTESLRQLLKASRAYQQWIKTSRAGAVTGFTLDATVLSSPYASSFGAFVEIWTAVWFGVGSVIGSILDWTSARKARNSGTAEGEVPADMSTTSLIGGGLIAGDSLAALGVGLCGLLSKLLRP
jgi:uncharacterized oligopeptide transporter (OPT) family protein